MTKQEYLQAMHEVYNIIYSEYDDKDRYTFEEGIEILQLSLKSFQAAFKIDPITFKKAMPDILNKSKGAVREGMSIDELLMGISVFVLRCTRTVNLIFPLKMTFWSLTGPLQIAPEESKNG